MTLPTEIQKEIEEQIQRAMQLWNIPGLAVAIVKDDEVLLAKGYGVRELNKPEKVDEHTLFAIASNTKAFTATAVGLLVQEGKLGWDDPVTKYLPTFRLYDPLATQLVTVRDLLCHRAGLGTWAGDVLLFSKYSTEEIVRRVGFIPPEYGFRAGYGYCNLTFVTAGLLIQTVSGMSWDEFIRTRIFDPLGMKDSVPNPHFLRAGANVASPHEDIKGQLQVVAQHQDDHVGAAGSIFSSAADLAQWMRMQIACGKLGEKQIVDEAVITETHTPHTTMRLDDTERKLYPSRHFAAYGLGWFLADKHGRFTVRHTGGIDGMLSMVYMTPEEKLGVAVITNKLPNSADIALPHYISEKLLGMVPQDWIQIYADHDKEENEKQAQANHKTADARAKDTQPSLALEKYAGEYDSAILGGATIRVENNGLFLQLEAQENLSGKLTHWHYDTFQCAWNNPVLGESLVPFITDGHGQVTEFRVKIREDWIDPLEHVFKKQKS